MSISKIGKGEAVQRFERSESFAWFWDHEPRKGLMMMNDGLSEELFWGFDLIIKKFGTPFLGDDGLMMICIFLLVLGYRKQCTGPSTCLLHYFMWTKYLMLLASFASKINVDICYLPVTGSKNKCWHLNLESYLGSRITKCLRKCVPDKRQPSLQRTLHT